MLSLRITTVGSSSDVILPRKVMAHLKVQEGDRLCLTEARDGSYRLTPYDPELQRQMVLAEEIMREDQDILRALAR